MYGWPCRLLLLAFCASLPCVAAAQSTPPLRLKARTFVPSANVHAGAALARRGARMSRAAARRHLLIQFAGPITRDDLAALEAAGAVPLRYVPDNALAISAGADFDAATVARARWVGTLEPVDRVSAESAADIARPAPSYPLTVIEFHPDVDGPAVDTRLALAQATRVPSPLLPAYLALISTDRIAIEALSTDESVAWIYPAASTFAADSILGCEGTLTPVGVVANFATVGEGWDGPGLHGADLSYFVQYESLDIGADSQRRAIERALAEWSRYVNVRWRPASRAGEARSVTILWGGTEHGDGYPFSPEVLAHTFYPAPVAPESYAGDVHFNDNYLWGIADASRYDVFSVALHELGHALGLGHAGTPGAVMYPMYQGVVIGLAEADIEAARHLYERAVNSNLPSGWTDASVGVEMSGTAIGDAGRYTIDASGRDVWDTFDEFRFVSTPLVGDGDIVARLDSLEAVHRWTKAGVMIRATNAPGSPHAFLLVSGSKGLAFQRRRTADALSVSTDGTAGTAPRWLWLSRRGTTVEAYAAADGEGWRFIGSDTIALGTTALAGLAVTSHDPAAVATAVFSQVSVTPAAAWTSTDIGAVGRAGSWTPTATGGQVAGAGEDIWDAADAFRFAWIPMRGDGEIVARVASVESIKAWTKAGVMIRASLSPGSPHAFMLVSAGKGFAFQRRAEQGGWSAHTAGGTGAAPGWVRLVRSGHTISAYRSTDGRAWSFVGSDTITMPRDVLVGLAVSSHTATATARATFENVTIK